MFWNKCYYFNCFLLVGESSGKANKSIAKHIPGSSMQDVSQRATSACSEVNRAHKLMLERGEKLSQLEERSERMRNEAENFSSTAHDLMLKYKDKKWYQLWTNFGLSLCIFIDWGAVYSVVCMRVFHFTVYTWKTKSFSYDMRLYFLKKNYILLDNLKFIH